MSPEDVSCSRHHEAAAYLPFTYTCSYDAVRAFVSIVSVRVRDRDTGRAVQSWAEATTHALKAASRCCELRCHVSFVASSARRDESLAVNVTVAEMNSSELAEDPVNHCAGCKDAH